MNAPTPPRSAARAVDAQEETRETLHRIENTLGVILTSQLELHSRVAKLEGAESTAPPPSQPGQAIYPPVYQGPERRRDRQPSFTTETMFHVKEETEKQTPILQSMPPMMATANNRIGWTIVFVVVNSLATIAYALIQLSQSVHTPH